MKETYQDGAGVGLVVDKEWGYLGYTHVLTTGKRNWCINKLSFFHFFVSLTFSQ